MLINGYINLEVLKHIFNFVLGPPLPRGVPGEGPDCHFQKEIVGVGPIPARILGFLVFILALSAAGMIALSGFFSAEDFMLRNSASRPTGANRALIGPKRTPKNQTNPPTINNNYPKTPPKPSPSSNLGAPKLILIPGGWPGRKSWISGAV